MSAKEFDQLAQNMPRLLKDTGQEMDDPGIEKSFEDVYGKQTGKDDSKGKWYDWVCDSQATDADWENNGIPDGWPWLWVPNGTTKAGNGGTVLDDETLAEIAASALHIPDLTVNMSPDGHQTVNFPTWFSVSHAAAGKQSETASLPAFGMSVTVTAVPTELDISVTGPDADTDPASLSCPVNKNGTVGAAESGGRTGKSSCSLTFLRATPGSHDTLNASLTWNVDYPGSGAGWPKKVTVQAPPQDIDVREIQTVNR
jgi:hypothetical protein